MKYIPGVKHLINVRLAMGLVSVLFCWHDQPGNGRVITVHSANRGGISFDPKGSNLKQVVSVIESAVGAEYPLPDVDDEVDADDEESSPAPAPLASTVTPEPALAGS